MRRATVLAAFAASALLSALGEGPSENPMKDPAYWYLPEKWSYDKMAVKWEQRGQTFECTVRKDGTIEWVNGDQIADIGIKKAVEMSLLASMDSSMIEDELMTMARRIADLDWGEKDAEVEDTASGKTASGTITRTPVSFVVSAPGVLSGGGMWPDGVTIQTNASGRASLLNWDAPAAEPTQCLDALGDMLDGTKESGHKHYVLTRFGENGALHYTPVGSIPDFDPSQFEKTTPSKIVTIKGSTSPGNAGKVLASTGSGGICWTNIEAGVRVYADGTQLPWFTSGIFALGGSSYSPRANFAPPENWAGDGIVLVDAEHGADVPKRLALDGLAEAEEGTVPTATASGGIEWKKAAAMAELRVTGTDGNAVSGTNLVFRTAEDSDVRVTATVEDGAIVLTFGVYYR